MEVSGGRAPTRQNERSQRGEISVERVDLALEPFHLRVGDGQARSAGTFLRETEIRFHVEQVVLYAREQRIERLVAGVDARQPDGRAELVQRSIGSDAQVVFLPPFAVAPRGGAVIAGARIDPVENDHRAPYRPNLTDPWPRSSA